MLETCIATIIKRDGSCVPFDLKKIQIAIQKALLSTNVEVDTNLVSIAISEDVHKKLIGKGYGGTNSPTIENIQDTVENSLIDFGWRKAAKNYIIYREQHNKIRDTKKLVLDVESIVDTYLSHDDWRVNENANAGYCYASLLNHVSGDVIAKYTLSTVYPEEIKNAHINGDFHLHDLSAGIIGYCAGWSLRDLLMKGFCGKSGRASAAPAKHLDTICGQIVNFMCTLQTEWA